MFPERSAENSSAQTGKTKWEEARAVAAVWENAQTWDGPGTTDVQPVLETSDVRMTSDDSKTNSITIERAIQAFTSDFSEYAAPNTQKKYKLVLRKLSDFSKAGAASCSINGGP